MKNELDRLIIPKPTIVRLSTLFVLLENLQKEGQERIFSAEIGKLLGVPSHTIRKDISFLRQAGNGNGYDIINLKNIIAEYLGFNKYKKACIVGMGRLGTVITTKNGFYSNEYTVVAGFDNNDAKLINDRTDMTIYPMDKMKDIIEKEQIKIGMITVPQASARKVANDLIACGIKGIINFSPVLIEINRDDVFIRNIFIAGEFNILSALISQYENKQT
ncbi:MAG: redox-sensing transcriptional repressor Rex [Spirochaetaceae bacterium]